MNDNHYYFEIEKLTAALHNIATELSEIKTLLEKAYRQENEWKELSKSEQETKSYE